MPLSFGAFARLICYLELHCDWLFRKKFEIRDCTQLRVHMVRDRPRNSLSTIRTTGSIFIFCPVQPAHLWQHTFTTLDNVWTAKMVTGIASQAGQHGT